MSFPIFEAIMMLCFGLAWPASIAKSWKSKTNKGKSLLFLVIITIGYLCGLIHKLWWQDKVDGVVWLYIFNGLMVSTDMILYFRNMFLDRMAIKNEAK